MEVTLEALRRVQPPPAAATADAQPPPAEEPEMAPVFSVLGNPALDFDVVHLHEQAEEWRREAALARARAEREFRMTLGIDPPAAADAAGAPAAPLPAGVAPSAPLPPEAPAASITWRYFARETDDPSEAPEQVVARVRDALARGLVQHAVALSLRPDEHLVVAVDFLPRASDTRAVRTLQARVRQRDLAARRANRLNAEELGARIVFEQF
jgi:hypothetical protein